MRLPWMCYKRESAYVICYASKLAGCAGMHPFVAREELSGEARRLLGKNPEFVTTGELAAMEMDQLDAQVQANIKEVVEKRYDRASEVQTAFRDLAASETMAECGPGVMEAVRSSMYTRHGNEQEASIRSEASDQVQKRIKTEERFAVSKDPLCTVHGVKVYVGGRHDGMTEDGVLVEIKTRQRRFLGTPQYELVQIHAYMVIYNVSSALLVESLNGDVRRHEIKFDPLLWERATSGLESFYEEVFRG